MFKQQTAEKVGNTNNPEYILTKATLNITLLYF